MKTHDDCPHEEFTYSQRLAWSMGYNEAMNPKDIRNAALEEAAQVILRMSASMRAHTNQDGLETGADFFAEELAYIEPLIAEIRSLKS